MRHPAEEQLVAFRVGYAEPDEAAAIEQHLGACEACRASLGAIELTLSAAAQIPVPERSEGYGAEVWARIQPRLERPAPGWRVALQWLFVPQRLAYLGGVALLVLAAFVAGRYWPQPETRQAAAPRTEQSPAPAAQPVQEEAAQQAQGPAATAAVPAAAGITPPLVRQGILLVAVGDHLERSQIALAELVNIGDASSVDITSEQERARDLVVENRLYRHTALETGDATLAAALDDLERVLVEVANGPSELSTAEFERVRDRIEAQGIIFKVRVLGERVREQQIRPAADGRIQG